VISPGPYVSGFFAVILKVLFGCKYLLSVYASNIYDKNWMRQSWFRFIYRFTIGPIPFYLADSIQTDGLETVSDLRARFGDKVFLKVVVPKNIETFKEIQKEVNLSNNTTFLFVGRMTGQKNLDFLSKLIRYFQNENGVFFRIVGDGKLRRKFIQDNQDLIKVGKIIYSEKLSRTEIIQEYKKSDVFILTSLYEGFARVSMEAAAAGLPIITTKVSGVDNLIKEGINGFVINQGDLNCFMEKMMILHKNHNLIFEMGNKSQELFKKNFSYSLTINQQKMIFNYLEKK
jgi:glycosyltransferase involved in cell wall biosynthesis